MTAGERLVGRSEELALVDQALDRLDEGNASVIQIAGEPGIGKTSLLAEVGVRAEGRRYLVLSGRASELEHDLPHWIFVDALDEYVRTLDPARVEALDRRAGGELARVLPSLELLPAQDAAVLDERYRVHHAVRALLEELAGAKPLVLLLDDLHWADAASVDLLAALLRRPPQAPVLLGLALRTGQAPPRLATALEHGRRDGLVRMLELWPLAEDEAGELLGADVTPTRRKALYEESGGNPFYLEQLARTTTAASGGADAALAATEGVPPAVAAALVDELAGVTPEALALLEGGAVVGDPFTLDFAAAAAGMTAGEALAALDDLVRPGLIQRTDAPRRFRFRHPLLRSAVYETIGAGRRSEAHERAAQALAEHGEPAVVRAHHVAQFAPLGDRDAVAVLREAADSSAQRAPASAARWYRAALDLLPSGDADREERIALLERLADVLAGDGRFAESHAALEELLAFLPADAPSRTQVEAACAGAEHHLGRHEEAHARLVAALERVPDQDSPQAASLTLDLGMDAFYGRDYERMRDWGLRAHASAALLGDAPLRAAAAAMVSVACAFTSRIDEARSYRDEAATIVDALTDTELARRLDAVANLGNAETYLDRFEDAVRHLDRGMAVGRATGQGRLFPLLTQRKGFALALLGRVDEAVDVLDRAVEAARLSESPQSVAWALLNRSWAATMAGDLDTALAAAEESVELGRRLDDSPVLTWSACALGSALIDAGEPARCIDTLVSAGGGAELPRIPGVLRTVFMDRVVQAYLALGRVDEAEKVASAGAALASELGLGLALAMARRMQAEVALARGDVAAAVGAALEAATAAESVGARIKAARARVVAARALVEAGERERAASELERAAAELDACGAVRYRDEAERELRRLGRRHHRRRGAARTAGQGVDSLTAREREVAELVHDRKTNREIAAELFLSEKTIETHLRHIFGKLGVSTRASVARAIEDERSRGRPESS